MRRRNKDLHPHRSNSSNNRPDSSSSGQPNGVPPALLGRLFPWQHGQLYEHLQGRSLLPTAGHPMAVTLRLLRQQQLENHAAC